MQEKFIIGVMSGTSLDGIDIAIMKNTNPSVLQENSNKNSKNNGSKNGNKNKDEDGDCSLVPVFHHYEEFPLALKISLKELIEIAPNIIEKYFCDAKFILKETYNQGFLKRTQNLEHQYSIFASSVIQEAIKQANLKNEDIELIGLHGQTIYHAPANYFTWQIGCGRTISDKLNIDVINNFRIKNVLEGGQGAPLAQAYHLHLVQSVPAELFPVGIINIGGISNISYFETKKLKGQHTQKLQPKVGQSNGGGTQRAEKQNYSEGLNKEMHVEANEQNIIAFDIGPGGSLIDDYCQRFFNIPYDKDGEIARNSSLEIDLLQGLMQDKFFNILPPKSLDRCYFDQSFKNLLKQKTSKYKKRNVITTLTYFTAYSIAEGIELLPKKPKTVYLTGGGRLNKFLLELIKKYTKTDVVTIEELGVDGNFLESEIFAYLALQAKAEKQFIFEKAKYEIPSKEQKEFSANFLRYLSPQVFSGKILNCGGVFFSSSI